MQSCLGLSERVRISCACPSTDPFTVLLTFYWDGGLFPSTCRFSSQSKDVSPLPVCPAGLFPSSRVIYFPTLRMTSANLCLVLCHLVYTERFQKKGLTETSCFICGKEVEDNTGYVQFPFYKSPQKTSFLVSVLGIITRLPTSGFVFTL